MTLLTAYLIGVVFCAVMCAISMWDVVRKGGSISVGDIIAGILLTIIPGMNFLIAVMMVFSFIFENVDKKVFGK